MHSSCKDGEESIEGNGVGFDVVIAATDHTSEKINSIQRNRDILC
jgi:hypothetical protein